MTRPADLPSNTVAPTPFVILKTAATRVFDIEPKLISRPGRSGHPQLSCGQCRWVDPDPVCAIIAIPDTFEFTRRSIAQKNRRSRLAQDQPNALDTQRHGWRR